MKTNVHSEPHKYNRLLCPSRFIHNNPVSLSAFALTNMFSCLHYFIAFNRQLFPCHGWFPFFFKHPGVKKFEQVVCNWFVVCCNINMCSLMVVCLFVPRFIIYFKHYTEPSKHQLMLECSTIMYLDILLYRGLR